MSLRQHAKACLALLGIVINLTAWCVFLVPLIVLDRLVFRFSRRISLTNVSIYRLAVLIDDWLIEHLCGVAWRHTTPELNATDNYIVIANHRSWSDIFILQSQVTQSGPIIKFLCKSQLLYIPIFALIITAFRFPVVRRRASKSALESDRRKRDLESITEACKPLTQVPAAMLVFPEGTRAIPSKIANAKGDFEYLLPPKMRGFETLIEALAFARPKTLNYTLLYPADTSFWQFLGGVSPQISVHCSIHNYDEVTREGAGRWLQNQWVKKENDIRAFKTGSSSDINTSSA